MGGFLLTGFVFRGLSKRYSIPMGASMTSQDLFSGYSTPCMVSSSQVLSVGVYQTSVKYSSPWVASSLQDLSAVLPIKYSSTWVASFLQDILMWGYQANVVHRERLLRHKIGL